MATIRPMLVTDMPAVLEIQAQCYGEIVHESAVSLQAKLTASPSTCFAACRQQQVIGYLVSLPWRFEHPPELNAATCELPANPDALYLHDLAVAPAARQAGAGGMLVATFIDQAVKRGFRYACLIAVQNSAPYWQRHGFQAVHAMPSIQAKVSSYGEGVHYMQRLV